MKKIIGLLIICFVFGGLHAVKTMLKSIWVAFKSAVLPLLPMIIENFITDPYVIVKIIMFIGSGFGVWFGVKGGKALYFIVAIICAIISLCTMFAS